MHAVGLGVVRAALAQLEPALQARRRSTARAARRPPSRGPSRARTARAARGGGSRSPTRGRSRRSRAGRAAASAAAATRSRRCPPARPAPRPSASGPRCASSASACSGVSSQTPARFFEPASVSTSCAPPSNSSRNAGVFGPFSPGRRYCSRPAVIRWTSRTSSPSSVGNRSRFARRRAPASRRPSSAESGGSNVFSVAMCAGPGLRDRKRAHGLVELAAPGLHLRQLRHLRSATHGSHQGTREARRSHRGRASRARGRGARRRDGRVGRRPAARDVHALVGEAGPGAAVRARLRGRRAAGARDRLGLAPRRPRAARRGRAMLWHAPTPARTSSNAAPRATRRRA